MIKSLQKTTGLIIIAVWVGVSIGDIGKTYPVSENTWTLPFIIFIGLFPIWLAGYWAGKE